MSSFTNIVKTASSAQTQPVMAASVLGVDEAVKNNLPDGFTKSTANGSVWYDDYYDESYSIISAVNKVVTVDEKRIKKYLDDQLITAEEYAYIIGENADE